MHCLDLKNKKGKGVARGRLGLAGRGSGPQLTDVKLQWKEIQPAACCAEAPAGEAGSAQWKIPAEDVFPFPTGRQRVLLEAGDSLENAETHKEDDKMTSLNSEKLSKQVVGANVPHCYSVCA